MKRVAFYRRAGDQTTSLAGTKERVAWRLSKGPATGTELAEIFGITRVQMNHIASKWKPDEATSSIKASEWFQLPDGGRDRTYSLERKPRRVTPSGETPRYTRKTFLTASKETKRLNTERAKLRARLIAAGLYIDEFN